MKKIGNRIIGENPREQIKLERKRFEARQKKLELDKQKRKEELLKLDDGKNQKLF